MLYVISVKRIRSYTGKLLDKENQYWEYAMVDRYGGSFSTGYACFGSRCHAETFETISEAKEWITKHIEEFKLTTRSLNYDLSTLAIRKCIYKTEEKIKLY